MCWQFAPLHSTPLQWTVKPVFVFVNHQNKPQTYLYVIKKRVSEFLLQSATRWTFHGKRYLKGEACCDPSSVIQTQGHVVSNVAGLQESSSAVIFHSCFVLFLWDTNVNYLGSQTKFQTALEQARVSMQQSNHRGSLIWCLSAQGATGSLSVHFG